MSGGSYRNYGERASHYEGFRSSDAGVRHETETARAERVAEARSRIDEGRAVPPPIR